MYQLHPTPTTTSRQTIVHSLTVCSTDEDLTLDRGHPDDTEIDPAPALDLARGTGITETDELVSPRLLCTRIVATDTTVNEKEVNNRLEDQ